MDTKEKHEKFLYPCVRVLSARAGGSGTIIYSEPDPVNEGDFVTIILTNHHVVDSSISYRDEWDSVLKKDRKQEIFQKVDVDVFDYVRMSTVDSAQRYKADIVAYDKVHDLALLKMDSPRKFPYVATLIPEERVRNLRLFQDVVVAGCSLLHDPFCTFGQITYLSEIIDMKEYLMSNANSIFGNSGGALYLKDTGELLGVPSRVTVNQLGFGLDVQTWMGFSSHPKRLYEFFREQEMQFLFDRTDTFKASRERREKMRLEGVTDDKDTKPKTKKNEEPGIPEWGDGDGVG